MLTPEPSLVVATWNMGWKGGLGFTATMHYGIVREPFKVLLFVLEERNRGRVTPGIAALGQGIRTLVLVADNLVSAVLHAEN